MLKRNLEGGAGTGTGGGGGGGGAGGAGGDPDEVRARTRELASAWAAWAGRLKSTDSQTTELMWFAFQAGFEAGSRRAAGG